LNKSTSSQEVMVVPNMNQSPDTVRAYKTQKMQELKQNFVSWT